MEKPVVKVRFAPSPTGRLHLGSARTAVFNWLYARHCGGKFVLRIEDTDLSRSEDIYTESIIADMKWLGMGYDEFYKQSGRFEIYPEYADRLIQAGKAYYCTCSKEDVVRRNKEKGLDEYKYDRFCRKRYEKPAGEYTIRVDTGEERNIAFQDIVKNKITVSTKELDDFVIMKSGGTPTYNFAVVVDDALMGITHIIRGEDHITNTAKQIILYEHLKLALPQFAHLPLVMDKDKSPLSKRKGSTNIEYYRALGILPEALLNAIARLGWSHGNDEVFTVEKLIELFDIGKLNKSNAVYDEEKMIWINGKHLKTIALEKLTAHFEEFMKEARLEKKGRMLEASWLLKALDSLRPRHKTMKDLYDEVIFFACDEFKTDEKAAFVFEELMQNTAIKDSFTEASGLISGEASGIEEKLRVISEKHQVKFGDLVQAIRIKLTGNTASPGITTVIELLGGEARKRIIL